MQASYEHHRSHHNFHKNLQQLRHFRRDSHTGMGISLVLQRLSSHARVIVLKKRRRYDRVWQDSYGHS